MPERAARRARIDAGVCVYGGGRARGRGLACEPCARAHAERESDRRRALREEGTCLDCGQRPAAPGRYRCDGCLAKQRRRVATRPGEPLPPPLDPA
jgi:hypothetical protein